jgi:hypothetical protein
MISYMSEIPMRREGAVEGLRSAKIDVGETKLPSTHVHEA